MANYTFTNTSGYNNAVTILTNQFKAIQDDTATAIFTDDNIFDLTTTMKEVPSQANFPLLIYNIDTEEMNSGGRQSSDLVINCYIVFNVNLFTIELL